MFTLPAAIPSPPQSEWDIGPLTLRAYALCIVVGIVVAIVLGARRWAARGGDRDAVYDVAVWAVLFGIVGARLYHVITDNHLYFGAGRDPVDALKIWEGGLGIWGAIAFGAVGAWIACRRKGIPLPAMADALAPGIVLAQAIGRWGNWFNQELFGRPTDLPWGLKIDPMYRPDGYKEVATFHPTFLYESLWCLAIVGALLWADRRFQMGHGRVFALYVALYTVGRTYFEFLRIDPATEVFGFRVNFLVSIAVCLAAVGYIVVSARRRPGREAPEDLQGYDESAFSADDDTEDEPQRPAFVGEQSNGADAVSPESPGSDPETASEGESGEPRG